MRHTYASPHEKRVDFWWGFTGWFAVNVLAGVLIQVVASSGGSANPAPVLSGVLLLLNLAVPIVLAFTRGYLALGILLAFATAFGLVVIDGVFFTVGDFVAGVTSSFGFAIGFLILGFVLYAVGAFFVLRAIHRGIK